MLDYSPVQARSDIFVRKFQESLQILGYKKEINFIHAEYVECNINTFTGKLQPLNWT